METATETAAGTVPGGNGSLPIVNNDQLTVDEISSELGNLSSVEHERYADRRSALRIATPSWSGFDRKIKARS